MARLASGHRGPRLEVTPTGFRGIDLVRADRSGRPRSARTLGARADDATAHGTTKPDRAAARRRFLRPRSRSHARREPKYGRPLESPIRTGRITNAHLRPSGARPKALLGRSAGVTRRRRDRFGGHLSRHAKPSPLIGHVAPPSSIEIAWPQRRRAGALRFRWIVFRGCLRWPSQLCARRAALSRQACCTAP